MAYAIQEQVLTFNVTFTGGVIKRLFGNYDGPNVANDCIISAGAFGYAFQIKSQMGKDSGADPSNPYLVLTVGRAGLRNYASYLLPVVDPLSSNNVANVARTVVSGSCSFSIPVYLCIEENRPTDGSGHETFPTFGGTGSADPPTYRNKRIFFLAKPGGTLSISLSTNLGDATFTETQVGGTEISPATVMSATISNAYNIHSNSGVYTLITPGEACTCSFTGLFNGASCSAPGYSFTQPHGYIDGTPTASIVAAATSNEAHNASVGGTFYPQRKYNLNVNICALNRPYPGTIGLKIDEDANHLAQSHDAASGAFSLTKTQHQFSVTGSVDGVSDPDPTGHGGVVNEYASVRCWLRPGATGDGDMYSLLALGEDPTDWRVVQHGMTWNALTLQQATSINVDAAPTSANWTAGANTTLGSGLTITVSSAGTGSVSSTLSAAAPTDLKGSLFAGVSFAGYRTLRLNLTADAAGQPARVHIGSKTWDVTVGTSGYVEIDLCCPTNATATSDGTDSTWPWNSATSVTLVDGPLWGVSNVASLSIENLAAGHTYTLSGLSLQRKAHSYASFLPSRPNWLQKFPTAVISPDTSTTTYARRFVQGNTDGRQSIELEDVNWLQTISTGAGEQDSYPDISILSVVNALRAGANMPSNGWTATDSLPAPTSGCTGTPAPLRNCGLNSNAPSAYLYGGGLLFGANAGVSYGFDVDCTGGAASIPAQELFDELTDWVPCGDVFGFGPASPPNDGTIYLCAGKILDADSWGVTHKAGGSARNVKVRLSKTGTSEDDGVGLSDRYGEYRQGDKAASGKGYVGTGTPFGKGTQTYVVTAAAGVTPPSLSEPFAARRRQRASFFVVPVTACCDRVFCSDPIFFPFAPQSGDAGRLPVADGRGLSVASGPGFVLPSTAGPLPWQLYQYSDLPTTEGPFGFGWRASWPLRLCEATSGTAATGYVSTITMEREDGNSVRYVGHTAGPAAAPPTTFTSDSPRLFDTLLRNADRTWDETRFDSGAVFHYPAPPTTTLTSYNNLVSLAYYQTVQGQRVSFSYNSNGQMTTIQEPGGREVTYTYQTDPDNPYVSSVQDWAGRLHSFQYDGDGNLNQIQDPTGALTTYAYDGQRHLTNVTDPNGVVSAYAYDDQDRVVSRQVGSNPSSGYSYAGGTTTYTDPLTNAWATTQDGDGNVTSAVDPLGATRSAAYTAQGQPQTVQDALGRVTSLAYDSNGRLTSLQNPRRQTATFTYDSYGNCLSAQDPENRLTTYTYGADPSKRRLASLTTPVPSTYVYSYMSWGALQSVTTPLGNITTLTWDSTGVMTNQTDPLGKVSTLSYDAAGNLMLYQDEMGRAFTYTYDGVDRPLTRANTRGGYWQVVYDGAGNPHVHIDPLGRRTTLTYNAYNQPTLIKDARNNLWGFGYDGKGRPQSQTDPLGNTTAVGFDIADRLIQSVDGMGRAVGYQYDPARQLTTVVDTTGLAAGLHYDLAGQLDVATAPTGLQTSYFYNNAGQPIAVQDSVGLRATTVYDPAGRVQASWMPDGARATTSYDADSRPVTVTDARGFVSTLQYDRAGRVTTLTDATGRVFTSGYDASGLPIRQSTPFGTFVQYEYDSAGRLQDTVDYLGRRTSYTYYANDLLYTVQDFVGNVSTYSYDAANNLTTYQDALGQFYLTTYDAACRPYLSTDPLNHSTGLEYDASYALTTLTNAKNEKWGYLYDTYGRPQAVLTPLNTRTTTLYDSYGRYGGTKTPDNTVVMQQYDVYGRASTVIDGRGCAFAPTYDAFGRSIGLVGPNGYQVSLDLSQVYAPVSKVGSIDPLGHRATLVSDPLGRSMQYVDALGKVTSLSYNSRGILESLTDPMNRTVTYSYDGYSRPLTITDPANNVTTYYYNDSPVFPQTFGRLWYIKDPLGHCATLYYDPHGRRDTVRDASGHCATTIFDPIGRVQAMQDEKGLRTTYSYDELNRLQALLKPSGAVITNVYDSVGRISGIQDPAGKLTTIAFDDIHRQIAVWRPDNTRFTKTYDATGNLVQVINPNNKATTYSYDCLTRVTKLEYPLHVMKMYEYDGAGRMTTFTNAKGQITTYTYTVRNQKNVKYLPDGKRVTYTYNDAGQRTKVEDWTGVHTYQYDKRGFLVTKSAPTHPAGVALSYTYGLNACQIAMDTWKGSYAYGYDACNLLLTVTDPGYAAAGVASGTTSLTRDERGQVATALYPNGTNTSYTYNEVELPLRMYHCASSGAVIDDIQYTYNLLEQPLTKTTQGRIISYAYDSLDRLGSETTFLDYSSLTLQPVADGPLANLGVANTNQGTATFLQVNHTDGTSGSGYNRVSYLKFDLRGLKVAPVSAKLQLTQSNSSPADTNTIQIKVYAIANTTWSETGITWNTAPGLDSSTGLDSGGTLLATQTVTPQPGAPLAIDLTSFVAAHLGQLVTLQLISETASAAYMVEFNSRKASAGRPCLALLTTQPPLPQTLSPIAYGPLTNLGYANTNQSALTVLQVNHTDGMGSGGGYNRVSYLKLDLSGLSVVPTSALLQLTQTTTSNTGSIPVNVYGIADTSWSESMITWNSAPGLNSSTGLDSGGTLITSQNVTILSGATNTFDITSYVAANLGKQITLQVISETASAAYMVEYNGHNAVSGIPQLTLSYAPLPQSTLAPIANDTIVDGSLANVNQGMLNFLQVNRTNGTSGYTYNRASYLKLDLTSLSTVPASALLQLTQTSGTTSDPNPIVVKVYGVTDTSWSETGLTWNNAPGLNRTSIVGTGVLITSQSVTLLANAVTSLDITSYIGAHLGQQVTIFLISEAASAANFVEYNSRRASANTPQLVLKYVQAVLGQSVYAYDPVGRRQSMQSPTGMVTYAYDDNDALTTLVYNGVMTTYAYDNNGNRIAATSPIGTIFYSWDTQDQLVGVVHPVAGTFTMTYSYDGLRLTQQSLSGLSTYIYDGDDVLVWQKGGLEQWMVQGEDLIRAIGTTSGGTALNRQYYADAQGTTTATTNAGQSVESAYQTDAWGNTLASNTTDNPYVYGGGEGYWQEPDLGLMYVRARWLDTQAGTWLSNDPVEGEPHYDYAYNSPTVYTDPSGCQMKPPWPSKTAPSRSSKKAPRNDPNHGFSLAQLKDIARRSGRGKSITNSELALLLQARNFNNLRPIIDREYNNAFLGMFSPVTSRKTSSASVESNRGVPEQANAQHRIKRNRHHWWTEHEMGPVGKLPKPRYNDEDYDWSDDFDEKREFSNLHIGSVGHFSLLPSMEDQLRTRRIGEAVGEGIPKVIGGTLVGAGLAAAGWFTVPGGLTILAVSWATASWNAYGDRQVEAINAGQYDQGWRAFRIASIEPSGLPYTIEGVSGLNLQTHEQISQAEAQARLEGGFTTLGQFGTAPLAGGLGTGINQAWFGGRPLFGSSSLGFLFQDGYGPFSNLPSYSANPPLWDKIRIDLTTIPRRPIYVNNVLVSEHLPGWRSIPLPRELSAPEIWNPTEDYLVEAGSAKAGEANYFYTGLKDNLYRPLGAEFEYGPHTHSMGTLTPSGVPKNGVLKGDFALALYRNQVLGSQQTEYSLLTRGVARNAQNEVILRNGKPIYNTRLVQRRYVIEAYSYDADTLKVLLMAYDVEPAGVNVGPIPKILDVIRVNKNDLLNLKIR